MRRFRYASKSNLGLAHARHYRRESREARARFTVGHGNENLFASNFRVRFTVALALCFSPMLCWLWASTEPNAIRSFAGGAARAPSVGGYSVPRKDANARALERGVLLFSVRILTSLGFTAELWKIFLRALIARHFLRVHFLSGFFSLIWFTLIPSNCSSGAHSQVNWTAAGTGVSRLCWFSKWKSIITRRDFPIGSKGQRGWQNFFFLVI